MRFNLTTEPWLPVAREDGSRRLVGIRDALIHAHEHRLEGETAWQEVALLRMLLAIAYRAGGDWAGMWAAGRLDADRIDAYLAGWHHRFWLDHEDAPFMQIPHMTTTGQAPTALIPDGALYALPERPMGLAEAARWVVAAHAYHPSGIKPASSGDPRAKRGKSYPVTAWLIDRNAYWLDGGTLARTLLLTMPPLDVGTAAWEHPAAESHEPRDPTGVADILTWQARRIRLDITGDEASIVHLSNGHPVTGEPADPMIAYRTDRSTIKPLRLYSDASYHGWHQLHTLLGDSSQWITAQWLRAQAAAGLIAPETTATLRILGPVTDVYRARITDLHPASVPVSADPDALRALTTLTAGCVLAARMLERNLATAAGNISGEHTDRTATLLAHLDPLMDDVLAGRAEPAAIVAAVRAHGRDLVQHASAAAWKGRVVGGELITANRAEGWFYRALTKASAAHDRATGKLINA